MAEYACEESAIDALFGTPGVSVRHTMTGFVSQETRDFDGAWRARQGPINTRVSGVISTERLTPWSPAQRRARLILNPWARSPFPAIELDIDRHDVIDERLRKRQGRALHQIFGLPQGWPD
jgi:hypothetical protein